MATRSMSEAAVAAAAASNLFGPADDAECDDDFDGASYDGDDSGIGGVAENTSLCKTLFLHNAELKLPDAQEMIRSRLVDGQGEFIYLLGNATMDVDQGFTGEQLPMAVENFLRAVKSCNADAQELRRRRTAINNTTMVEYLVRVQAEEADFMEIRVAVVGNVDAGKSTMLGVLTHGELDNGRGLARQRLFRHKHELESGRTSSVGNDILGFDSAGSVVNKPQTHGSGVNWERICRQSSKVITFIDLAGHERYLKTTVFGMTGHAPDFCMLMVGSNAGVIGMTKEHLGLALALNVPVFVVVTKIDMCPPAVLQDTLRLLTRILKSPGCRKIPLLVNNDDDVILAATNFVSERMCPVFQVSNVTGENLDLLKRFLNLLSSRMSYQESSPAEFQVDDTYQVPGVGTVIAGTTLCGVIRANDTLLLGPDPVGRFDPCTIKSIHRKRMPVTEVRGGQTATFALKKIRREKVRKGMVLVAKSINPLACYEFEGEILVLHHPTTISAKYQAMVHCGSVRQTASIMEMSRDNIRTGDKALCHFRFIKSPEYLRNGARLVFREGRTKAVGHVTKVIPYTPVTSQKSAGAGRRKLLQQQQLQQQPPRDEPPVPTASAATATVAIGDAMATASVTADSSLAASADITATDSGSGLDAAADIATISAGVGELSLA
eukprot:scpid46976/ scgid21417/ GTP-binding protein 1